MEEFLWNGADRLTDVGFSPIRTMIDKVNALKEEKQDVISFVAGEPDFHTPMPIKEATIQALLENQTHYGSNRGNLMLRKKISARFLQETGVYYQPHDEILITNGGAEGINHALLSCINPGDEVIIFSPSFINYENLVQLCGGVIVSIPLKAENNFQIDPIETESHITCKTKMIILNNPCNPTGTVYTKETLSILCEIACRYNVILFSDEIYSKLTYDVPFYSIASFPNMKERSIILSGFSKTYAMTGWRLGYLLTDSRLYSSLLKVHQYASTCCPTFTQIGLAKALDLPETEQEVAHMLSEFKERRDLIISLLDTIPKLHYVKPAGAFYVFVDVSETGLDGQSFANALLEKQLVGSVLGTAFGTTYTSYIRLSYATSKENIKKGMQRIQSFVACL